MTVEAARATEETLGFEPERTTYRIRFEPGHAYHGLEVAVRSASLGKFLEIAELAELADQFKGGDIRPSDVKRIRPLFDTFASCVVSWNLLRDGKPLPITAESILDQDMGLAMTLIEKWMEAVAAVPAPLSSPSSGGKPSVVPTIPMEPLPSNRSS